MIPSSTKADFRAMRETVGMSVRHLAILTEVNERTVRRWERPDDDSRPPLDAWDALDEAKRRQDQVVGFAIRKALSIEQEQGGKPNMIALGYYPSAEAYEVAHPDEPGDWLMANANSRLVAFELRRKGFEVAFSYGE